MSDCVAALGVPVADATTSDVAFQQREMICVPGGAFRMGSDERYPEGAPVHRVTVDTFWIDRKTQMC